MRGVTDFHFVPNSNDKFGLLPYVNLTYSLYEIPRKYQGAAYAAAICGSDRMTFLLP